MDERNRAAAPAGPAEETGGTFQWGTDRPAIGKEELAEAQATLTKYKSGKANLENRVVEDELWWELRHWEVIGRDKRRPGEARPTSAWLFNTLINKHADAMDNYPAPVVLPREQSDEESARVLSAVLPVILENNEHEKVYSDGWWEKLKHGTAALTGTDSSVDALKTRIEKQMQADLTEIRVRLKEHPELVRQMTDSAITLSDPDEILQNLQVQIQDDFPALTDTSYTLKYVPEALESSLSPAFFLVPPIDSDGSNTIYINEKASTEQNLYTMLAHEGYPGHLYQSAYFNDREPVPVRRLLACGGYNEGWGLYSELYAYSFDNGLPEAVKPLMRCSEASSYGLYALLDICIHYDGWDLATTTSYLENSYGFTDPESAREIYLAIIDNPGNYLKYYTGYLEILTMRQEAEEVLGNKFNAKSFHQFILNMDGASFRVIKPYFQTWLMTEKLHV